MADLDVKKAEIEKMARKIYAALISKTDTNETGHDALVAEAYKLADSFERYKR